jgi:hypothetical protein
LVTIQNFLEQQEDIFAIASKISILHKQINTMCANIGVQTTLVLIFKLVEAFDISEKNILSFKTNQETHIYYYWPSNSFISDPPIIVII